MKPSLLDIAKLLKQHAQALEGISNDVSYYPYFGLPKGQLEIEKRKRQVARDVLKTIRTLLPKRKRKQNERIRKAPQD